MCHRIVADQLPVPELEPVQVPVLGQELEPDSVPVLDSGLAPEPDSGLVLGPVPSLVWHSCQEPCQLQSPGLTRVEVAFSFLSLL
jgi:hypothetical protein